MIRVAFVAPSFGEAEGQGRVNLEIVRRLATDKDFKIDVFTSRIPRSGIASGVSVALAPRPFPMELANQIVFMIWATLQVRKHRYDVVHSDGASLLSRHVDVVAAHMLHALATPSSKSWYHSVSATFNRIMEERAYRNARMVLANSEKTAADVRRLFGASNVRVMPLGVDSKRFTPPTEKEREDARARLGAKSDDFIAVIVGAAEPRKGVPQAIEALASLEHKTRLVLVGDPRDGKLVRSAKRRGVKLDVRPWPADPLPAYRAADVLLAPAVYEPFGLCVLEAMACGVPVVVSSNSGVAAVCNGNAIQIDPTARDIKAAIETLRDDRERAASMGRKGRAISESRSWDATALAVMDAYREIAR
ncbi:MAG: glycosyltransferase [Actinomycetota bacterium]